MLKKAILGWNAAPGAPKNWKPELHGDCGVLPIRVTYPHAGEGAWGDAVCESAWEPTGTELEWLNRGGQVVLRVVGWQPPVALYVEQPPADVAKPKSTEFDRGFVEGANAAAQAVAHCRTLLAHALNALNGTEFFIAPNDPEAFAKELRAEAVRAGYMGLDNLHHAPRCPANHFHEVRMPTGPCSCGARLAADGAGSAQV
jgi:hypothetical protein